MSAPVVGGINTSLVFNQVAPGTSLFTVSDPEGDSITQYEFWDSSGAGVFRIGGAPQAAEVAIPVSAPQLASVDYLASAGPSSETVWVRASDGSAWSGWAVWTMRTQATPNAPALIEAPDRNSDLNQWRTLNEFITVGDADLDAIARFEIEDLTAAGSSGYLWANGVALAQGGTASVSDAASTWIRGGSAAGPDQYRVRAFDGFEWGDWTTFTITTRTQPNRAPVASAPNASVQAGATVAVGTLFTVVDADGDAALRFELWDSAGGGYFQTDTTVQPEKTSIPLTPVKLANTVYVGGAAAGNETLWVRVDDGQAWSAWEDWTQFTQTRATNALAAINAPNRNSDLDQWRSLSELVTVTDVNGDPLNQYELRDLTATAGSGYLWGNGANVPQGGSILVSDLASTWIRGGSTAVADTYEIRAFDTFGWSAWAPFTITTRTQPNRAPVASAPPKAFVITNQTLPVDTVFTLTDVDADSMLTYRLWDSPGGGYFKTGTTVQPSGREILLIPAEWAQTVYVGGPLKGSEQVWGGAYDGQAWSIPDWRDCTIQTLRATNELPVVVAHDFALTPQEWRLLSTYVGVTDADGDPIERYEIRDLDAAPTSGYLWGNGMAQGITLSMSSLADVWVRGASVSTTTDAYEIRAQDSETGWSAWQPFGVVTTRRPTVVARDGGVSVDASNHEVPARFFFKVTEPDGEAIQRYDLWDSPGGGYFRTGTTTQPSGVTVHLTPAEMATTAYVGASSDAQDPVWVRASDGWLDSAWAGWTMYTVAAPERYPELVGTAGNETFNATSTPHVYFGRGGDDLFVNAAAMMVDENVFIGGVGADTYRLWGGNTSTAVADIGSSVGDVADVKFFGFSHPEAIAAIVDGRHLFLGEDASPYALNAVVFFDWQEPENRIETWQLFMGATYTYDQFNQALASFAVPRLTWQEIGLLPWEVAQVNEAITYYALRELAAQGGGMAAPTNGDAMRLVPQTGGLGDYTILATLA